MFYYHLHLNIWQHFSVLDIIVKNATFEKEINLKKTKLINLMILPDQKSQNKKWWKALAYENVNKFLKGRQKVVNDIRKKTIF